MRRIRCRFNWNISTYMELMAIGFVIGIIYENFAYKTYDDSVLLFEPYYLEGFLKNEYRISSLLWTVLKVRILPLVLLFVISCSKFCRWLVGALSVVGGYLLGVLAALAVIKQGLKGVLLYIAMLFPHFLLYGLAYCVVVCTVCVVDEGRWNVPKILTVVLAFVLGVLSEIYVMPFMIRLFV